MKAAVSLLPLLMALCLLAASGPAHALTTCTASSTPLAFGSTDGTANADTTATITVSCTTTAIAVAATVRVRMCLGIGDGGAGPGQFTPRLMANTFGDPMQFQIYRDASRTQVWGSTGAPSAPTPLMADLQYFVVVVGGANTATYTMYARIPPQSGLAADAYASPFTDNHTRLDYRYAEQLIGTPSYPASCTSGGSGGGTLVRFPFTATATVPDHCTIDAADELDFGSTPGLITSHRDQDTTIGLTCTRRTAWHVALDNGQNAIGNSRRMRLGASGNYVAYELYRDAARTERWGTALGSDTAPGTGIGSAQAVTVHGRVPAPQTVPPGEYRDVVTVRVTY